MPDYTDEERVIKVIGPLLIDALQGNVEPEQGLMKEQVIANKVFSVLLGVYADDADDDDDNMFEWTDKTKTLHLAHVMFRKGYFEAKVFGYVVDEILCY